MIKKLLVSLFLLYTCLCFASIYMEQKNGSVIYSDTPSSTSKAVSLPSSMNGSPSFQTTQPAKTSSPTSAASNNATASSDPGAFAGYNSFEITSPLDQASIQNQPSFGVTVKSDPELRKEDKVQLVVDDKLYGSPQAGTQLTVGQLDRGTHQIYAIISDDSQKILKRSNIITVFVHRISTITRPNQ